MVWWKQYALSIVGCILLRESVLYIAADLRYEKIIRLVCGTLLAITMLAPITSLDSFVFARFDTEQFHPEKFLNTGKMAAQQAQEIYITEACESYILSVASTIGADITAKITLNEDLHPSAVQMHGKINSQQKAELEQILEKDLGITKENQVWIWSQEKDSS